jgi:hypothetical protein
LRGHGHDLVKACNMYSTFLQWRQENNVDAIREEIVQGRKPVNFPYANDFLIRVGNQVLISAQMRDKAGSLITVETYHFDPNAILEEPYYERKNYKLYLVNGRYILISIYFIFNNNVL